MALTRTQFEDCNDEATRLAERLVFLRDAFDGCGGFASLPPIQVRSASGAVASIPSWAHISYLIKHEGENWKQYEARRIISRYVNHVRRGIGHFIGLLTRRPPTRTGDDHPKIKLLLNDCDGCGTSLDAMREKLATWGTLFPGVPWTVDRPFDPGARTEAENRGAPRLWLRSPDTLYDWRIDSRRQFEWCKFVEQLDEKHSPEDKGRVYLRATIWHRDRFETWEMDQRGSRPPSLGKNRYKNALGLVPAGVFTYADATGIGELFGWSPGGELADLGSQDFNDLSRLTDFLARGTFPMFLVPVEEGDEEEVQQLEVGTMTAYGYPKDSSHTPGWATQDAHPVDSHTKRRETNEAEGLRSVGLESLLRSTAVPSSGLAKQYENEHLDGSLRRLGQRVDRWERQVARFWLLCSGEAPETVERILDGYRVQSPESYGIEDLDALIAQARETLALPGVDPYTHRAVVQRVSNAIAKLDDGEKKLRDGWLEQQLRGMLIGLPDDHGEAGGVDEEGNEEEQSAPAADSDGGGAAGVLLAASDKSAVVTVNEVRQKMGLGDLVLPTGKRDPDGDLTVQDFIAKREALRDAQAGEGASALQRTDGAKKPTIPA